MWTFTSFNIIAFYTSNLRVNLIAREYEQPVETATDVLKRDQTVYIPDVTYGIVVM